MRCSGNHLRIKKMKWQNGELVIPDTGESFTIRVESCSSRRHYRLNSSNNFCVELDFLSNEELCVYEDNVENDVTYRIDGVDSEDGCVDFSNRSYHEIIIINGENSIEYGSLRLNKHVIQTCGNMGNATSFRFVIEGENYEKRIVLNEANQYTTLVSDIPFGNYEVKELNNENYDVTYVVDGVESEYGNIEINSAYGEMHIYNRRNDEKHVLRIDKWISENGKLKKPVYPDSYDILLNDGYAMREYTLNCSNRFSVSVEGNRNDTFTLEEVSSDNVMYELDGEIVEEVSVTMSADHEVRIININNNTDKGSLRLQKWIEEDGRLVVPSSNMTFQLRVLGYSDTVYTLNSANNFTLRFDDLEEGYYQIREMENPDYDVSFEVDGVVQEDGYVRIRQGEMSNVSIINTERGQSGSMLHIVKRMGQELEVPTSGNFDIYVQGPNGARHVMLNEDNNFEQYVRATTGWYTIYEVNPSGNVIYRLDGVDHDEELYFYVEDFDHEVVIINLNNRINYII